MVKSPVLIGLFFARNNPNTPHYPFSAAYLAVRVLVVAAECVWLISKEIEHDDA